jgi:2-C-methyl-D-erythritol 2,4-cyclodiphosphate synthase
VKRKEMSVRIGHGYDVHRMVDGRKLILGGVEIPFLKGLEGHSDADVLLHAVCDALLGSLSLGDIGTHFPDKDPRFKDISSLKLLGKVSSMVKEKRFIIGNIDVTIVAQEPRLSGYISQMGENIARTVEVDKGLVNIKATTTEGLGFAGKGEGIAAHAVVLVESE